MKEVKSHNVVLLAALLIAWNANAVELGKVHVFSHVNEPLKAKVEMLSVGRHEIRTVHVKAETTSGADVVPKLYFLPSIEADGKSFLNVTTRQSLPDTPFELVLQVTTSLNSAIRGYAINLKERSDSSTSYSDDIYAELPSAKRILAGERKRPFGVIYVPKGETLGDVASEVVIGNASLHQKMVALYLSNLTRFDGNMNQMKPNAVLSIPHISDVLNIDRADAKREVLRERSEWKQLVASKEAARLPTDVMAGTQAPSGVPATADELLATKTKELEDAAIRIMSLEKDLASVRQRIDYENAVTKKRWNTFLYPALITFLAFVAFVFWAGSRFGASRKPKVLVETKS